MAYTNPGFVNGQAPYLNATNINNLANEVQSLSTTLQKVPINKGGTNATTASAARTNLGLDTAGINALVAGNPLPVANGGTGQTSRTGILDYLGIPNAGDLFQIFSGQQYRELKGYSTTTTVSVNSIGEPSYIYVGGASSDDYIRLVDLPDGLDGNLHVITFASPSAPTQRRVQFVIPEVGNLAVYMKIIHGSTTAGWSKINFTAV